MIHPVVIVMPGLVATLGLSILFCSPTGEHLVDKFNIIMIKCWIFCKLFLGTSLFSTNDLFKEFYDSDTSAEGNLIMLVII